MTWSRVMFYAVVVGGALGAAALGQPVLSGAILALAGGAEARRLVQEQRRGKDDR